MKQIFKKTILAVAIAGLSNYAVAGSIPTTTIIYSVQGLQTLAPDATRQLPSLEYTLGANYIASDEITITFSPGALAETDFSVTVIAEGNGDDSITFSLLEVTENSATYRVTAVTDNFDTTGTNVIFAVVQNPDSSPVILNVSSILADDVTVTYSSIKAGSDAAFDEGTEGSNTAVLTTTQSQITPITVVQGFNGVIDVNDGRTDFTDESEGHDTMVFEIGNDKTLTSRAYFSETYIEIGIQTNDDGEDLAFTSQNGGETSYEDGLLTVVYTEAVTTDTIKVDVDVNGITPLIAQEFSVSASYYDGEADDEGEDTFSAGEDVPAGQWTLNGNEVNIPYMPYGPGISQILYVTNSGDFDGVIYVTAYDEDGETYPLGPVATAGANSVTKFTGSVKNLLAGQGFTKGKLSIDVTVNAPDADITVQAGYNVGADRGFVITDQYKKPDLF